MSEKSSLNDSLNHFHLVAARVRGEIGYDCLSGLLSESWMKSEAAGGGERREEEKSSSPVDSVSVFVLKSGHRIPRNYAGRRVAA